MAFTLTPADVSGLLALIRGQSVAEGISGYRTLSGFGNNELNPTFGAADNPFIRITDARFGAFDPSIGTTGLGNNALNPIFTGIDPRTISNVIGQQEADLPKAASGANLLFSAFGQYVDHGLDFLEKGGSGTVEIGGPGISFAPGSDNPADLTRGTVVGVDPSGATQHLNKTANFVEQNQTYGSNDLVGIFLREADGNGGITANLAVGGPDPSNPAFTLLPTLRELILLHWDNNTLFTSSDGFSQTFQDHYPGLVVNGVIDETMVKGLYSDFMGTSQPLLIDLNPFISPLDHIVAGDGRVNENVTLTTVHTIWARNHNFHVDNLAASGFAGTAEELFQAAKIINEAEYQRVVYNEFTDVLLGGMKGSGSHGWGGYNPDVNPAISHEFAAASYRFGHSIVTQTVQVVDANGQITDIALFDAFLNPTNDGQFQFNGQPVDLQTLAQFGYVPQPGYEQLGAGAILKGISQQAAEEADVNVVDALRNDLVRMSADLFAFNVARGRDVGLGTLNQVRISLQNSDSPYVREAIDTWAGNVSPYTSWEDFQARNNLSDSLIAQFKEAYPDLVLTTPEEIAAFQAANPDIVLVDGNTVKGVDRVDLWVGGLAEAHINGGMVGQTFWVILHEQFDRLQEADRFYYLDRVENFDFYNLIDGGTEEGFGAIVARNTGMVWNGGNLFLTDAQALTMAAPAAPVDAIDPTVVGFTPADDATMVDVASNIEIAFSEDIAYGTGVIEIRTSEGALVEAFDIETSERVSISGAVLTIDPTVDLASGTHYVITLPEGIVTDYAGNAFAGTEAYDFTTKMNAVWGTARSNTLTGTSGGDEIFGLGGSDVLEGGGGNDDLDGGSGIDTMRGGTGHDRYHVDNSFDRVIENANAGTDTVITTLSSYTLGANAENLIYDGTRAFTGTGNALVNEIAGGIGNDTLRGAAGNDVLRGEGGNDNLFGDAGNDMLFGGTGNDVMNGGTGLDVFVFDTALGAGNIDRISGFSAADDTFHLSQSVFSALDLGALSQGAFNTGTAATQADDRIILNTRTGALMYDEDGRGGQAAVQFATLSGTGGSLSASDFIIV
jgi:Ca2+-binding RTX toxin-like protein